MKRASLLAFPLVGEEGPRPDLQHAADTIADMQDHIIAYRVKMVTMVEEKAAELEAERIRLRDSVEGPFKWKCSGLHLPLMKWLGSLTGVEDHRLPELLHHGLPIVGPALESPFFQPFDVPPTVSLQELLYTAPQR
eukprot:2424200-Heterocapsa_arctica.AAC.1